MQPCVSACQDSYASKLALTCLYALHRSIASTELPRDALHGGMLTQHPAGAQGSCHKDMTAVNSLWLNAKHLQVSQPACPAQVPQRWRPSAFQAISVMPSLSCHQGCRGTQPEMLHCSQCPVQLEVRCPLLSGPCLRAIAAPCRWRCHRWRWPRWRSPRRSQTGLPASQFLR